MHKSISKTQLHTQELWGCIASHLPIGLDLSIYTSFRHMWSKEWLIRNVQKVIYSNFCRLLRTCSVDQGMQLYVWNLWNECEFEILCFGFLEDLLFYMACTNLQIYGDWGVYMTRCPFQILWTFTDLDLPPKW